ncbi:hypothetical protein [Sorangium sp. So ce1099]|uniref:hypothetical protein n=1 Tax=Sorangium sp. So ce1099 TaxID=3133331 RepID=UPI003F5E7147
MSSLNTRIEHRTHRRLTASAAALSGMLALAAGASEASAAWTCSDFVNNSVEFNMTTGSYNGKPHLFYNIHVPAPFPNSTSHLTETHTTDAQQTLWSDQTLAGDPTLPGQHAGYHSPGTAATYDGSFYFPYVDWTGNLKVAYKTTAEGAWTHFGLDGNGENIFSDIGGEPAAIVFDEKLYIFYAVDDFMTNNDVLRVAVYDGATWTYQLVDTTGGASKPKPVVYDGKLRVYYRNAGGGSIRQAVTTNGTSWSFSVLDGDGGANGRTSDPVGGSDIAVVTTGSILSAGRLLVFYTNDLQKNLRVANFDGTTFTFSVIDGTGGVASGATSGDINPHIGAISYSSAPFASRTPYVFYADSDNHTLRAASLSGSSWSAIKLDGAASGNACAGAITTTSVGGPTPLLGGGGMLVYYVEGAGSQLRQAQFTP